MSFRRERAVQIRDDVVRDVLRDQPGIAAVESVVVAASARVPEVTVTLRPVDGTDAAAAACLAIDVLRARLPGAQILVLVTDQGG